MTRRKRSPSPPGSGPRKRVVFQIPDSLQTLSALSRTLAQQADSLAGVGQDDQNTRIIAQAQALGHIPPEVVTAKAKADLPALQKFVPQTKEFPEAQNWVRPKPWSFPTSEISSTSTSNVGDRLPLPIPLTPKYSPGPPQALPSTPLAQIPSAQAYNEPPAQDGEPLCLATQPHQIAALIAKKRAENEANRQREKWAQEQFAHQLSQAPDDQLLNELHSQLDEKVATPVPHRPSKVARQQREKRRSNTSSSRTGTEQFQHYLADRERTHQESRAAGEAPRSARQSQGYDTLFSSTAASPTVLAQEKDHRQPSSSANMYQATNRPESLRGSFSSQLLEVAGSLGPEGRPATQPHVHSQPSKPIHYPPNTSYTRQSVQQHQSQTQRQPPAQANIAANGPGYYRIDPRLWSQASSSEAISPYTPSPFQSPYQALSSGSGSPYSTMPNLGKEFRNLTQDRFGRYGVNGQFIEGVQAGQLSDMRTRMSDGSCRTGT